MFTPGTDDAQAVDSPGDDMNQSGYEADDEVSSLPSPADTDAIGSEMDDSQHESSIHADSGQITLGNCGLFSLRNNCSANSTPILFLCYHSGF